MRTMRAVPTILILVAFVLAASASLGAAPPDPVRVDDWSSRQPGPLELGKTWQFYPFETSTVKQPPSIVVDDGRPALSLATEREPVRVGRTIAVDVREKPWLVWEWKPLVLPDGGD